MNELMLAEIGDQPEALGQSLGPLREQAAELPLPEGPRAIYFTGCGDSYIAALASRLAWQEHLELTVEPLRPMEAWRYTRFRPGDVVVCTSISGEVRRTVEAARVARAGGAEVVAITGKPTSTLARVAEGSALVLPVLSRSRATPHTTDYLTSLLALAVLLERVSARPIPLLDRLAGLVADTLASLPPLIERAAEVAAGARTIYLLGAGPSYATAAYGAAKLWEAGGIAASPHELEDFCHGPHLMLAPGDAAILVAPSGRSFERATQLLPGFGELDVATVVVTDADAATIASTVLPVARVPEEWSPFLTSLPLQLLTLSVANRRGYDVVSKAGHIPHPERYEDVMRTWVQ